MTNDEARARVSRGAALLDEKRPGWAMRINTRRLQLDDACNCVLGQLEGSFAVACDRLFTVQPPPSLLGLHVNPEVALGFNTPDEYWAWSDDEDHDFALLQAAWIEAITARLIRPVEWTMRDMVVETVASR